MGEYVFTDDVSYKEKLIKRLERSADRICELQDKLRDGVKNLTAIEFERLADEYHNENCRYDCIDSELKLLEKPSPEKKQKQRLRTRSRRQNINY